MSGEAMKLDKYGDDDDLLSLLLRIGLYVGALFQLICIASSIMLPQDDVCGDCDNAEIINIRGTGENSLTTVRRLHKLRKQEKKKRR